MDDSDVIAIGALIVGALGVLWGVYSHFSNRKYVNLFYEINQLSDYGVPESFVEGLATSLISIRFSNQGNSQATDIVLDLTTFSDIENVDYSGPNELKFDSRALRAEIEKLNPSQEIKFIVYCSGSPAHNQVRDFELTHADGTALDRKDRITAIDFSVMGVNLTYNLISKSIGLR